MNIERAIEKDNENANLSEQYGWDNIDRSFIMGGVSDGINKFDIPEMYKEYIKRELDYYGQFLMYGESCGSRLLVEVIKLYEQAIVNKSERYGDIFCKYLSITNGATAAIYFMFCYFKEKYTNYKVKMLGLQYFIFEENCINCEFEFEYIVSRKKNHILPSVDEIREELVGSSNNIVIMTLPCNPSGEIYTYNEIVEICKLCIDNKCILVIDKCQLEILSSSFMFINIGEAVLEAGAEDITIFIDSLSKTRSIPGARIGYIFSNDYEMEKYIQCYSALVYACPIRGFESAITMDMLIRTVYFMGDEKNWISKYRNLIIMYNGYEAYKKIYGKIFVDKKEFEGVMMQFVSEIQQNFQTIKINYEKTKNTLCKDYDCIVTNLQGGFNFCILIKDICKVGEKNFLKKFTKLVNAKILSQSFFGKAKMHEENGYWCRISAALEEDKYNKILEKIKIALEELQ